MQQTKLIMGMPITVEVVDSSVTPQDFRDVFSLFKQIDRQFSPYKKTSEVSRINRKEVAEAEYSEEMREILSLAGKAKDKTNGYFDVYRNGYFDPSGVVKGWAIQKACELLKTKCLQNFSINAGGDVQVSGNNSHDQNWRVGIRHPFEHDKIVKTIRIENEGIATSGTYLRGEHIYNPLQKAQPVRDIVSLSVIGPDILYADLMATAAFAMGRHGIHFIDSLSDCAGYMIDKDGVATYTRAFEKYVI